METHADRAAASVLQHGAAARLRPSPVGARRRGSRGDRAFAQGDDLAPYRAAKINWKQVEGESITVAVIPASYFENLITLQPQFEALTGVKLRFEKVPPGQIRQKALLDLSSKTATYATHAADPMYYPLYVVQQVGRAARQVPERRDAHRRGLVQLRRHHQGLARRRLDRRQALRHPLRRRGDGAGLPQGPVRRQGPEAGRHLRPAASPTPRRCTDPANRVYGLALRGFAGAGQNMYIYPSLFRGFGGNWLQRQQRRRQLAARRCRRWSGTSTR